MCSSSWAGEAAGAAAANCMKGQVSVSRYQPLMQQVVPARRQVLPWWAAVFEFGL